MLDHSTVGSCVSLSDPVQMGWVVTFCNCCSQKNPKVFSCCCIITIWILLISCKVTVRHNTGEESWHLVNLNWEWISSIFLQNTSHLLFIICFILPFRVSFTKWGWAAEWLLSTKEPPSRLGLNLFKHSPLARDIFHNRMRCCPGLVSYFAWWLTENPKSAHL